MVYATVDDIRTITGLTTDDITDSILGGLGTMAYSMINRQINVRVVREPVGWIDNTRQNDIDSSNTTFYVKNWKNRFIGDSNNDGTITTSDMTFYQVASDGTEGTIVISSITANEGKYILTSAPTQGNHGYVTYEHAPVSVSDPDGKLKLALIYLAASMAQTRINIGKSPSVKFGSTTITRDMKSPDFYYQKYLEVLTEINTEANFITEDSEKVI